MPRLAFLLVVVIICSSCNKKEDVSSPTQSAATPAIHSDDAKAQAAKAWTAAMSKYVVGNRIDIPTDSKDFPRGLMSYEGALHYVLQGPVGFAELDCTGEISLGAGGGSSGKLGTGSKFKAERIQILGDGWRNISKCSFAQDGLLVVTVESGKSYKVGFGFNLHGSIEEFK